MGRGRFHPIALAAGAFAIGCIKIIKHQHVDATQHVTGDGVFRRGDDRFLAIEAGIEQHRHAGETREFLDQAIIAWVGRAIDGLDAARTVDVNGGRNDALLVGAYARRQGHERVGLADLEVFRGTFGQDHRRKWPKWLALLDAVIEFIAHFRAARIGQNGAIAERTWAHLEATLEPSHDLAIRKILGNAPQQLRLGQSVIVQAFRLERPGNIVIVVGAAVVRMRQLETARKPKCLVRMPQRAAERSSGVGGARRHPDAADIGFLQDFGIGDAIECDATGHAQIAYWKLFQQSAHAMQDHLLGDGL